MMDISTIGAVGLGGVHLLLGYIIWTMNRHRDDFIHHAHDSDGKPFVKKRASDL